jgi:hypothetical protein
VPGWLAPIRRITSLAAEGAVIDPRSCLILLGRALLAGIIGYLPTVAICWAALGALRDLLPPDALMVGMICVALPLWPVLSFVAWWVLFESPRARREAAMREAFTRREPLTEEAFNSQCSQARVTAEVRAELRRFIGRSDVADRLLPSDPIRATCELAGFCPDDLDWAEFLSRLESRFGVRFPDEAFPNRRFPDGTVAELLRWCAGTARRAEPGTAPDRSDG